MEIAFFDDDIERFIGGLEKVAIAKTLRTLDLLERFGNLLGMPHSKSLGKSLFELRVRGKHEVRLLYAFHPWENRRRSRLYQKISKDSSC